MVYTRQTPVNDIREVRTWDFNWGERSKPHTCGENGKLSIYMYVWYVRIPYIYILPHLCAMQYFHIACWYMVHVNHCCSRDKTSRTERLNNGNQCNRDLKTVRKGRHG